MLNIFAIGASRHIGYYACLQLLQQGHHVVFLLRNPTTFDNNADIMPFIDSGAAEIVGGDALVQGDMRRAWSQATAKSSVDLVLFTIGSTASFKASKMSFVLDRPDICSTSLLNTLQTIPIDESTGERLQPKLVVCSAFGILKAERAALPLPLKPLWHLLKYAHLDKLGIERMIHHSAGWTSEWTDGEPPEELLSPGWESKLPPRGWLKHAVILRPTLFKDGEATGKYRVGAGEILKGCYNITRKDVAHFVVEDLLKNWEKYEGKPIDLAN